MSKGLRVLLHIFQLLALLASLLFMAFTFMMTYIDFEGTQLEEHFIDTWVIGFAVLAVAFSPALWSLHRNAPGAGAAPGTAGGYDRVGDQAPAVPQPPRPQGPGTPPAAPGAPGSFEPISSDRAPAPPASSYGQPSGPGFGAQPSAGPAPSPPPSGESPWGSGR